MRPGERIIERRMESPDSLNLIYPPSAPASDAFLPQTFFLVLQSLDVLFLLESEIAKTCFSATSVSHKLEGVRGGGRGVKLLPFLRTFAALGDPRRRRRSFTHFSLSSVWIFFFLFFHLSLFREPPPLHAKRFFSSFYTSGLSLGALYSLLERCGLVWNYSIYVNSS